MSPRQDPGSTILDVLEVLKTPARDSDEERITAIHSGGDKGMDQPLSVRLEEGGAEFGNVF